MLTKLSKDKKNKWYSDYKLAKWLHSSSFKSSKKYQALLRCLSVTNDQVNKLCLWNSHLNHDFFLALKDTNWRIVLVALYNCRLNNSFATKLNCYTHYRGLISIIIDTDPIGNKGVTDLIKLDLPELMCLKVGNTNVTNDIFKVIKKCSSRSLMRVGFYLQKCCREDMLIKEAFSFMRGFIIEFAMWIEPERPQFIYFGHLSKLNLVLRIKRMIIFGRSTAKSNQQILRNMMPPHSVRTNI